MANIKEENNQPYLVEFLKMANSISSTLDPDMLLQKIGAAAEKLTAASVSAVMLVGEDGKELYINKAGIKNGSLIEKIKLPLGEDIAGYVGQCMEPLLVPDTKKDNKFTCKTDRMTGCEARSILCVPVISNKELVGVIEVLNKRGSSGFSEADKAVLMELANFAAPAILNAKNNLKQQNLFAQIFEILTAAFESKSPRLTGHSFRVAQLATSVARELGISGKEYSDIYYGAVLHDVGFINIPDYSVLDHGTNREHAIIGAGIVKNITLLKDSSVLIKCHHEMLDGSGFPAGIKSDQIPMGAKIISLIEATKDMKFMGCSQEKVNDELADKRGIKFDPAAVDAYLKIFDECNEYECTGTDKNTKGRKAGGNTGA